MEQQKRRSVQYVDAFIQLIEEYNEKASVYAVLYRHLEGKKKDEHTDSDAAILQNQSLILQAIIENLYIKISSTAKLDNKTVPDDLLKRADACISMPVLTAKTVREFSIGLNTYIVTSHLNEIFNTTRSIIEESIGGGY